jgi:hypothetical protein
MALRSAAENFHLEIGASGVFGLTAVIYGARKSGHSQVSATWAELPFECSVWRWHEWPELAGFEHSKPVRNSNKLVPSPLVHYQVQFCLLTEENGVYFDFTGNQ